MSFPAWTALTPQDKFYLLSSILVPLLLWWALIGSKRYSKGA